MFPAGILLLCLSAPVDAVPQLRPVRGDEWTYRGTVSESVSRLDLRFRRKHEVEVRVLALEVHPDYADLAVLTLLRRADDLVSQAVPAVTGTVETDAPPAVRLDLIRLYEKGTAVLLLPPATWPLVLNDKSPVTTLPMVPLESFTSFEFGVLPPHGWTAGAGEYVAGERCVPMAQTRQSLNWDEPRGGQTAVQIVEQTWLSTRDGSVRKLHRKIVNRDGFRTEPAVTVETTLEVDSQTRVLGREFERYSQEIEFAYAYGRELVGWLPNAARMGPQPFEARLRLVNDFLRDRRVGTPYREAVLSVRRRLEAARNGEAAPVPSPIHRLNPTGTGSPNRPPVVRATVGP